MKNWFYDPEMGDYGRNYYDDALYTDEDINDWYLENKDAWDNDFDYDYYNDDYYDQMSYDYDKHIQKRNDVLNDNFPHEIEKDEMDID